MAKSSKKQCRKPKPQRQGGGLVVVTARNLTAKSSRPPLAAGKKGKKRKKQESLLGDLSIIDESDDFDASTPGSSPQPLPAGAGGAQEYLFSSAHARVQRLYYLVSTRRRTQREEASIAKGMPGGTTEEGGCHAVVFVEMAAVAQELVAELKALGLQAFVLHERTPKAQAQEHVKRFLSAQSAERSSVLLLTNAAITRSLSIGPVPIDKGTLVRVVHFDTPEGQKNEAARERISRGVFHGRGAEMVEEVHLEGGEDGSGLVPFAFEAGAMGGIRSRLSVAKKLARAVAMSGGEGEERSMQRAAAAAGLEWEAGAGQGENGEEAIKRERRRGQAQQATALREKMSVLLSQRLLLPPAAGPTGSTVSSTPIAQQQNSKELRKKMVVLGMIRGTQGPEGGTGGAPEDRAAAQTRWLDGSAGKLFGGSWDGSVRTGASCDNASLDMRSRVAAAKSSVKAGSSHGGKGGGSGKEKRSGDVSRELAKWKPNPDTPDPDKWGGRWGKPCGHNEVVLQHLRPFAPMEVMNTRVCSKASPAPGNTGFDGCVELLSLECRARERALTVWDDVSFLHIDKAGVCSSLRKQAMLHLSLPTLRFLWKNMRSFTVCGEGREPPREVARAVIRTVGWGAKQSKIGPLSAELSRRVLSFVLSGDPVTWRSVAAGLGVRGVRRAAPNANGEIPNPTVAFSNKKKRHNFNL